MRRIPFLIFLSILIMPVAETFAAPVVVERGDIEVSIELSGTVEAGEAETVTPAPAAWKGRWILLHAVEPGTPVAYAARR